MGKDLDNYAKNIAAKIANIPQNNIKAYDLYYDLEDFANIDTFITFLADTFKLKGLTTEVFISKWLYLYQTGTQYGTELFTSFIVIQVNAYCGSYIVNQKQIERCCGSSMVNLANAVLKLGVDELDKRAYMESSELLSMTCTKDPYTLYLASINEKAEENSGLKVTMDDLKGDIHKLESKLKKIKKSYEYDNKKFLVRTSVSMVFKYKIKHLEDDKNNPAYVVNLIKNNHKYFTDKDLASMRRAIDNAISKAEKDMVKYRDKKDDKAKLYGNILSELRKAKQAL